MSNSLEQLKAHTVVVADTGDFEAMKQFSPQVHIACPMSLHDIQTNLEKGPFNITDHIV